MSADETPKVINYNYEWRVVGTEEWKPSAGRSDHPNPFMISDSASKFVANKKHDGIAVEVRQIIVE